MWRFLVRYAVSAFAECTMRSELVAFTKTVTASSARPPNVVDAEVVEERKVA
jgi:hypothetical protein